MQDRGNKLHQQIQIPKKRSVWCGSVTARVVDPEAEEVVGRTEHSRLGRLYDPSLGRYGTQLVS